MRARRGGLRRDIRAADIRDVIQDIIPREVPRFLPLGRSVISRFVAVARERGRGEIADLAINFPK